MTSIDAALRDLKSLRDNISDEYGDVSHLCNRIRYVGYGLRHLRTFILCVTKLGNDMHPRTDDVNNNSQEGSLGSLLARIEEAVSRNAQKIHPYCRSLELGLADDVRHLIGGFEDDINSFMKEIDIWYIDLINCLQQPISPSTAADEVIAITASVLENLVDVLSQFWYNKKVLTMEPLVEKIKFLQSFIRFAMLRSVDQRQLEDTLNHIEALAVSAAHISFQYSCRLGEEFPFRISVLVQKIKPIDPHTFATYTQALTSSKLSRQSHAPISGRDDDPIMIMKDFVDSLMSDLWETLQLDTYPVVYMKDQLQLLYQGLKSLRTTFVKQPKKFDDKIKDFLGVLICDAGLIIFTLYQENVKVDAELVDLLERIEHIRIEVKERDPEASTSNFSRTNGLGFVDHLIQYLEDVVTSKAGSNAQSCAQTVKEELNFLRSVLLKIVDLHDEREELHALRNRILQVADRVESLIDLLVGGDISNSFSVLFDSIVEDINNIKTDASNITPGKIQDIKVNKVTKNSSHVSSSKSCAPKDDEVVGFDDESTSVTNRLTRGSTHLKIIAIVGMGGQGKTTLASKVYKHPKVMLHFHVRAFCSISQVFDRKKVLHELLSHVVTKLPDGYSQINEHDLAEDLRRSLKGRRYLIFLDDVWDIQVWNNLAESFPDDSRGSRIMFTSRLGDVAPPAMVDQEPHALRQLTTDESWELLQRKLFHGNGCPPELHDIGMQIAEKCKGLPLTIVVVAGLLASTEQEKWNEILESLRSGIVSATEQCMNTVELSYKHLPYYLKPCFLYFGMFPEDEEVSAKKLVWLWIAEGFVLKTMLESTKVLEDVATNYLEDLVNRSLVLVAQRRSIGGVKACRVHDLLHDFCRTKAKEENFFQLLRGCDELLGFNAPRNLRRLGIMSKPKHLKESKLFCPRARSLLFFSCISWIEQHDISFVIRMFKLLKVLDIGQISLGHEFPNEIGLLVQLRYLAVRGRIKVVPSSIENLSFLETFILVPHSEMVSFPHTFWNLRKLRHLCVEVGESYGSCFEIEILENSPDLYELESCSGAMISLDSMEKHLKKFPNVRKLKFKLFQKWDIDAENCNRIIVPDFLGRLESLQLSAHNRIYHSQEKRIDFEFGLPANLKKLTLSGFGLPWSNISSIGKLPNLEVLKLLEGSFSGEIWDMEEGEFSSLRFLKLSDLDIVKWTACDDEFPGLQKLVVERCSQLEEIPSYALGNSPTLEMIHLSGCSRSLTSLVKQIQEEQMNMGNSDLKVLVLQEFNAFDGDSDESIFDDGDGDGDGDDYDMAEALEMYSLLLANE